MAKNALNRKLKRDMRHSAMQFLAIVVLCSLGTFLFAGIDGTARMTEKSNETYFDEQNLADFWLNLPSADRAALQRVRALDAVETATARFSLDLETTLPDSPTLNVIGYDGAMTVNQPIVVEGEALDVTDTRGCLIGTGFAEAHGLHVGDRITVKLNGTQTDLLIRGVAYSPECVCVADGLSPNPARYGYALVNAAAMPIPPTQIVVTLRDGVEEDAARAQLQAALPDALIIDRAAHPSTTTARSNAQLFYNLSLVFPLLAYAVAALIVMTTLTRMLDQQRTQMGLLKALGYPERRVRNHYLAYALYPSLIGSVVGTLAGQAVIPVMVWALLIGQYEYPYRLLAPVSLPAWCVAAAMTLLSLFICHRAYRKSAREQPAELLRPKPPKAGRRIWLERLPFLWKRFGFNAKMVARNLLRNKLRAVMTLVGVLCCNALLIASFGLQDSIQEISTAYYLRALDYDVRVNLTDAAGEADAYRSRLDAERVESIMEKSVSVLSAHTGRTTLLTVLEDDQQLINLGANQSHVQLSSAGAIITEKLANTLRVQLGDVIRLRLPGEDDTIAAPVVQTVVNDLQQGVYMTRTAWEGLRRGSFVPTAVLLKSPTEDCMAQLSRADEVDSFDHPTNQVEEMQQTLDLLSLIFVMIMIIALALGFVVCYNMGLMNFAERYREYATLKVLGYHQREIRRLILNENRLLAFLGVLLGISPGLLLVTAVLSVCETETLHYLSYTRTLSVVLACAITFVFNELIQRLLTRKVRGIVMVEALKSVE